MVSATAEQYQQQAAVKYLKPAGDSTVAAVTRGDAKPLLAAAGAAALLSEAAAAPAAAGGAVGGSGGLLAVGLGNPKP